MKSLFFVLLRLVPCFHVEVRSHLPTSAGLGSSAAYSVCLASGLLLSTGNISQLNGNSKESWSQDDLRQINEWAFMAEKIIHGRPSGIDNSVSTYGKKLVWIQHILSRFLYRLWKSTLIQTFPVHTVDINCLILVTWCFYIVISFYFTLGSFLC